MQGKQRVWLFIGLMLIVFVSSLSLHADKLIPGGFWTLVLMVAIGGTGAFFAIPQLERAKLFWKGLKFRWKFVVIFALSVVYLAISFFDNRHKPDPSGEDLVSGLFLLFGLFLLGLYSLMSRGLDALWLRITRRR